MYKGKHLLGIQGMDKTEILQILANTKYMKEKLNKDVKNLNNLNGKSVVTMFYENSTRTKLSFSNAVTFLGGNVMDMSVANSSVAKGESLIDTIETIDALKCDLIVFRHSVAGTAKILADNCNARIINGGDGRNEHPTQALLDFYTMQEKFGSFDGLKVSIIGDIKHSRVARSNFYGLKALGAEVTAYAPKTLLPSGLEKMGIKIANNMEEALSGMNVVMGLRIQLERQCQGLFPSLSEYSKEYGINLNNIKLADKDAIVMHPGPINRNVELSGDLVDNKICVKNEQVTNGLAVRMALLDMMINN